LGAGWAWGGMLCVVSRARWTEPRAESISRVIVRSSGCGLFCGWLLVSGSDRMIFRSIF